MLPSPENKLTVICAALGTEPISHFRATCVLTGLRWKAMGRWGGEGGPETEIETKSTNFVILHGILMMANPLCVCLCFQFPVTQQS